MATGFYTSDTSAGSGYGNLRQRSRSTAKKRVLKPGNTRGARLPNTVKQQQEILRLSGFNIAADGIMGPITRSALMAHRAGVKPSQWNKKNTPRKILDSHHTNSARNVNNHFAPQGVRGSVAKIKQQRAAASPAGLKGTSALGSSNSDTGNSLDDLIGMLQNGQVNPKTYANALVEAKYGPLIGALHRQLTEEGANSAAKLAQIAGTSGAISSNIASRGAENAAAGAAALAETDKIAPGLAGALGLDEGGASSIRATGDIAHDSLVAANASQSSFDKNLASISEMMGQDLQTEERNRSSAAQRDINAQLLDQEAAKGSDFAAALQEATQQNAQNASQYVRDVSDLRGNDFNQKLALLNYRLARGMAPLDRQKAQADLESQLLGNELTRTRIRAANTPPKTGFAALSAQDRTGLHGSIVSTLRNPASGLFVQRQNGRPRLLNVQKAVTRVNAMLRNAGYNTKNPNVGRFALNILRDLGIKPNPRWYGLS